MAALMRNGILYAKTVNLLPSMRSLSSKIAANVNDLTDQTALVEDDDEFKPDPKYPRISTRFPPGDWKGMDRLLAWNWYGYHLHFKRVKGPATSKIRRLNQQSCTTWAFPAINNQPGAYEYQQKITNTYLLGSKDTGIFLPDLYQSVDVTEDFPALKSAIVEAIELENDMYRPAQSKLTNANRYLHFRACLRMEAIVNTILAMLGAKYQHIGNCSVDRSVKVEACFNRHNVKRVHVPRRFRNPLKSDLLYKQNNAPFQGTNKVDFQFRKSLPLPNFVPIDSEACKQARNLQPEYNPMVQGQFSRRTTLNITPGHNIGDEDFFTNLSVMCAGLEKIRECHGEETWKSTRSGLSLVTGFLACLSQAHAVGFNMHEELRYPISSQTILTDGRTFEFSGYQLNTTQLWKPPSANRVSNVAFVNPREELYKDFEHGRVVGFNDNVLKTLLKYFLVKPTDLDGAELLNCVKPKGKSIANYVKDNVVVKKLQYDQD
ncbi:28S ribosomal protein S30, mitochondrial-like [Mya arenaria]|uniref:28S ribosomal protein S30, mitochondrial-like n=1 Tax=Mya arenaria TaxID=6604 RepID=UPI0022E6975B|nr:28S ribosomal protein S30, mitochondrial-like [Mya arenaria]